METPIPWNLFSGQVFVGQQPVKCQFDGLQPVKCQFDCVVCNQSNASSETTCVSSQSVDLATRE